MRGGGERGEVSVVNKELGQWPRAKPGWRERRDKRITKGFESQEPKKEAGSERNNKKERESLAGPRSL